MLGKLFGGDTIKAVGNVIDELHTSSRLSVSQINIHLFRF
jgi:hypothetical protein